jgi:hypothetical protein
MVAVGRFSHLPLHAQRRGSNAGLRTTVQTINRINLRDRDPPDRHSRPRFQMKRISRVAVRVGMLCILGWIALVSPQQTREKRALSLQNSLEKDYKSPHKRDLCPDYTTGIVVACHERTHHLKSWSEVNCVNEVIVVDWLNHENFDYTFQNVKVITVSKNESTCNLWRPSTPYNLALQFLKTDVAVKIDCDDVLGPSFIQENVIQHGTFRSGELENRQTSYNNRSIVHLNGVLVAFREDIIQAGGFNEHIHSYGHEDSDLFQRLKQNVTPDPLVYNSIRHVDHSDEARGGAERSDCITLVLEKALENAQNRLNNITRLEIPNLTSDPCPRLRNVLHNPLFNAIMVLLLPLPSFPYFTSQDKKSHHHVVFKEQVAHGIELINRNTSLVEAWRQALLHAHSHFSKIPCE